MKQDQFGWGRAIVESLSQDLQKEFTGMHGFSSKNLWRMRKFYLTYVDNKKLAPMVREIGWSHNIIIMEKCKDSLEREFYIRMTIKYGWTIKSDKRERILRLELSSVKPSEEQ